MLRESASRTLWGRAGGDEVDGLAAGTGRILWRFRTTGEDMPSPAIVTIAGHRAIVFANGDDHLYALRLRDGHLLWKKAVNGIASMSSAAYDGRHVYVVVGGSALSHTPDRLLAVDPSSGRIAWSAWGGNADCSPAIGRRRAYVEGSASVRNRLAGANAFNMVAAIDLRDGHLRWRWYSGFGRFTNAGSNEEAIAPLVHRGRLYESVPAVSAFDAFDAASGRLLWSARTHAEVKMSAVELHSRIYVGDTGGTFYVLNAATGRVLLSKRFASIFTASPPLIAGGTLYIASDRVLRAIPLKHLNGE